MLSSIKLYAYAGAFAAFLALLAFAHHTVYASGEKAGEARGAKIAQKAEVARVIAEKSRDDLAAALNQANAAAKIEQDKAKAQEQLAADAVATSQRNAKDADKALAAWTARYAKSLRTTDCSSLAQKICPAVGNDY